MLECIECGSEIPDEDDAVWGQGTPNDEEFKEMVEDNETKGADDLFEFDDGPYCGLGCLVS
jgi:hypothetical protein